MPTHVSASIFKKIGDYKTKGVSRWEALDTDNLVFNTEDSAQALIRFENGATLAVDVSWAINAESTKDVESFIYGTKAGASIDPFTIYGEDENYLTNTSPIANKEDMFANEIRHFVDCVKDGKAPISPAADGLLIQKMLNGIYESARQGREIEL